MNISFLNLWKFTTHSRKRGHIRYVLAKRSVLPFIVVTVEYNDKNLFSPFHYSLTSGTGRIWFTDELWNEVKEIIEEAKKVLVL